MSDGSTGDPRLRFRVWIGGRLVDEQWIDVLAISQAGLAQMQFAHVAHVDRANVADEPWMIEIYDPEEPDDRAYFRFGTDSGAMVQPEPLGEQETLAEKILPMRLADGAVMLVDHHQDTNRQLDRIELAERIRDGLAHHGMSGPEWDREIWEVVNKLILGD